MLFNEPKLLKVERLFVASIFSTVSVLFNEPKLLKLTATAPICRSAPSFSALQRAEIAESRRSRWKSGRVGVSVLFNEPKLLKLSTEGRE